MLIRSTKIKINKAHGILAKLSVDQMLMKAKSHVKRDDVADAKKLYQAVLLTFPKNKRAQQWLASLNKLKQNNPSQNPPQGIIDQLINLYNQGQLLIMVEKFSRTWERWTSSRGTEGRRRESKICFNQFANSNQFLKQVL